MRILALEREVPGSTADRFHPHLKAEARRVWDLQQREIVRDIWFNALEHTAIILLECGSIEEASAVLHSLPLVKAGLIRFDLLPLVPYDGYARLFEEE